VLTATGAGETTLVGENSCRESQMSGGSGETTLVGENWRDNVLKSSRPSINEEMLHTTGKSYFSDMHPHGTCMVRCPHPNPSPDPNVIRVMCLR